MTRITKKKHSDLYIYPLWSSGRAAFRKFITYGNLVDIALEVRYFACTGVIGMENSCYCSINIFRPITGTQMHFDPIQISFMCVIQCFNNSTAR